jgi:hypothetical protein
MFGRGRIGTGLTQGTGSIKHRAIIGWPMSSYAVRFIRIDARLIGTRLDDEELQNPTVASPNQKDCRLHWGEHSLEDPVSEAPSHWHRHRWPALLGWARVVQTCSPGSFDICNRVECGGDCNGDGWAVRHERCLEAVDETPCGKEAGV